MLRKSLKNFLRSRTVAILFIVAYVYSIFPWRHRFATHHKYLSDELIEEKLLEKTISNVTMSSVMKPFCEYKHVIDENRLMYHEPFTSTVFNESEVLIGGEFTPTNCVPKFSTAIVVAYRNRPEHLKAFTTYIHNFLRQQHIHYRIFIVEQADQKPFNSGKLYNIGSMYAMKYGYPCLIIHCADLMPMRLGNLYACTKRPRHMCTNIDKYRYNFLYEDWFGGVVSIPSDTFKLINGMSNLFTGWGGDDDDFYMRLQEESIPIYRFSPDYGQYSMLNHKLEPRNAGRWDLFNNSTTRYKTEGLNSLDFDLIQIKLHKLYTQILVKT